jgi:hypothetical protein
VRAFRRNLAGSRVGDVSKILAIQAVESRIALPGEGTEALKQETTVIGQTRSAAISATNGALEESHAEAFLNFVHDPPGFAVRHGHPLGGLI